jgi:hypothetical protein
MRNIHISLFLLCSDSYLGLDQQYDLHLEVEGEAVETFYSDPDEDEEMPEIRDRDGNKSINQTKFCWVFRKFLQLNFFLRPYCGLTSFLDDLLYRVKWRIECNAIGFV